MTQKLLKELINYHCAGGWGKDKEFDESELVNVIRGTDFGNILKGNIQSVPCRFEKKSKVKKCLIQEDDILIEISGGSAAKGQSVGRTLLVTKEILDLFDKNVIPASFCRLIRLDKNIISAPYVYYNLQNLYKNKQITIWEKQSTGISNFQFTDFINELFIDVLNFDEYRNRIFPLEILDKKIELNQKMNETLEEIVQTLFKSWFIDFDPVKAKAEGRPTGLSKEINDFFPDSFEDSELGQIPEGFKVDGVDNHYDISIGKTPPRKEPEWFSENQQDIPWVSIKDMGDAGIYINKTSEFLTNEAIKKFNIHVIPKNNVILSFKLTVGRVAILQKDMCTNEAIAHFIPKDDDLSEVFTYCLLKSIRYESLSSTSSIATAVNSKIIKAMKCIFPSKALLIAFNEFCLPIYEKIEININEIETLISLRNTLLPKLISGELKIPDAENFIEEAGI